MKNTFIRAGGLASSFLILHSAFAQTTNSVPTLPPVPEMGLSFLRVLGALILVIAIFLTGVWLFRNWQRLAMNRGRAPQLNVLEVRSLGGRQALYVVGYERERFLLSASPAGVNLLTHLPPADETEPAAASAPQPAAAFGQVLAQMLRGGK